MAAPTLMVRKVGKTMELGTHMTNELKARISASMMGRSPSPATRVKLSAANKGQKKSPETRKKMSVAQTGKIGPLSPHWKGGRLTTQRKSQSKRRAPGFNALNSWFVGCESHHINLSDVIYIPEATHQGVCHDIWTGRNMDKINALAGAYLTEDWT